MPVAPLRTQLESRLDRLCDSHTPFRPQDSCTNAASRHNNQAARPLTPSCASSPSADTSPLIAVKLIPVPANPCRREPGVARPATRVVVFQTSGHAHVPASRQAQLSNRRPDFHFWLQSRGIGSSSTRGAGASLRATRTAARIARRLRASFVQVPRQRRRADPSSRRRSRSSSRSISWGCGTP
jgi:hypothetical protein